LKAAALLLAAALAACTPVAVSTRTGLHSWTDPTTVRIGLWEEPHTLNPIISSMSFEYDVYQLEFDGLIRFDGHARPIPDLAREVPSLANGGISRDGRTLTYHLVHNARWHDGVPVTAADVIYTWQQIMNPNNNVSGRTGYDRIVSIDAPDPYTVRVHLRAPYAPAASLFADGDVGTIVPRHLLARYANLNQTPFDADPVGSGPYIFRSWTHGSTMRFDANPHYFRGMPKIPHAVLRFIPDQNTMVNEVRAHDVDVYYRVSTTQAPSVRLMPNTAFVSVPSFAYEALTFNTQRAPLDDVRVRLALCYGYDQRRLFETIYHGLGGQAPTQIGPGLLGYDPAIGYYPFDPRKAGALLDAAGWRLGPNGIREKNGVPLQLEISSIAGDKIREELEVVLQSAWHALGIDVSVKNYAANLYFEPYQDGGPLYTGKTEVSIFTTVHSYPDPDIEPSLGSNEIPPAGQNFSRFRNAEMGRLIEAGLANNDPAVRVPIYRRLQQIMIDQVPSYTTSWEPQIMAGNIDLVGMAPNPVGSDLWNVADWRFGSR
jgi:peptide/nickel transport system substrate-binding protein